MKTFVAVGALVGLSSAANAEVIASWFTTYGVPANPGVSREVAEEAAGITASDAVLVPGLTLISTSPLNARSWSGDDLQSAIDAEDDYEFPLSVDPGLAIDVRYRGNCINSPMQLAILVSTDGFGTFETLLPDDDVTDDEVFQSIPVDVTGLSGDVSFRLHAWDADSTLGGLTLLPFGNNALGDLCGFVIDGEVIPAPGSAALLAVAGLAATRPRR